MSAALSLRPDLEVCRSSMISSIDLPIRKCPLMAISGHSEGGRGMSAYDPKRTFVELPNLHFFTPELIHAPERIGVLEFKLVPQWNRGQRAPTGVRFPELP